MTENKSKNNHQDELDFSILLASSIHDMKNSLAMLLGSISQITAQCMPEGCSSHKELTKVQHEGQRVNRHLIQLLTLYRIRQDEYHLNVDEQYLEDFLEEVALENQELLELNGIEINVDCDERLLGYFDGELVRGVINTIINNAYQYTNTQIKLTANKLDGYTSISVMDDGPGYPDKMILESGYTETEKNEVSFSSGSTGLGLYFSKVVADIHNEGTRRGYIHLSNDGINGGGKFTLYLP